jgi:hypothetical protein
VWGVGVDGVLCCMPLEPVGFFRGRSAWLSHVSKEVIFGWCLGGRYKSGVSKPWWHGLCTCTDSAVLVVAVLVTAGDVLRGVTCTNFVYPTKALFGAVPPERHVVSLQAAAAAAVPWHLVRLHKHTTCVSAHCFRCVATVC